MKTDDLLYLSAIGLSVLTAIIFLVTLQRSIKRLPNNWRESNSLKTFRFGVILLLAYLSTHLVLESVAMWLAHHWMYNSYVITINNTISFALLFTFFYINTSTGWKRYGYIALYLSMVIYNIVYGLYHPKANLGAIDAFMIFGTYFLAALLHLTELLIKQKVEYLSFQLKVSIVLLSCTLLATIIGSFLWHQTEYIELLQYTHITVVISFYLGMAYVFITETLKLRRG